MLIRRSAAFFGSTIDWVIQWREFLHTSEETVHFVHLFSTRILKMYSIDILGQAVHIFHKPHRFKTHAHLSFGVKRAMLAKNELCMVWGIGRG